MKKKIFIEGMTCEHCARHVTEALSEVEGVLHAEVNLKENYAVVEADGEISDEVLTAAVEEVEYGVTKVEAL